MELKGGQRLVAETVEQIEMVLVAAIDEPAIRDRLSIDPDYIRELASSIAAEGLQQAILVRPVADRFEIVYGDCRYLAHRLLGRVNIAARIRVLSDVDVALLRGIENLQRRDLTPIEEALSYNRLHELAGLTWEEISRRTGKSVGIVKRRVDLLSMPQILIDAIHERKITYSVAEVLNALKEENRIAYFLAFAVDHGATMEVVRRWVSDEKQAIAQQVHGVVESGYHNPMEPLPPVYVACDLCQDPMAIGSEHVMRMCSACVDHIRKALAS